MKMATISGFVTVSANHKRYWFVPEFFFFFFADYQTHNLTFSVTKGRKEKQLAGHVKFNSVVTIAILWLNSFHSILTYMHKTINILDRPHFSQLIAFTLTLGIMSRLLEINSAFQNEKKILPQECSPCWHYNGYSWNNSYSFHGFFKAINQYMSAFVTFNAFERQLKLSLFLMRRDSFPQVFWGKQKKK